MRCRQCGTEIAEKALICYRCGAATTDPVFQPPPAKRPFPWLIVVALVLVIVAIAVGVWLAVGGSGGPTGRRDPSMDRQLPNYQMTQLPNYQITQLPDYPIAQFPNVA